MKNLQDNFPNDKEQNEKGFKSLGLLFQLRIIAGFILSTLYPIINSGRFDLPLALFYLLLYSPLAVCIILFNKRKKAFRIWYVIGVSIISSISILNGGRPYSLIFEIIIVVAIFRWSYVNDFFTSIRIKKEIAAKDTVEETE